MTTIVLKNRAWHHVKRRIIDEHGAGIFFISWRLKRELGFTVRNHIYYDEYNGRTQDTRLDFDDPAAATFFQIKYL